MTKKANVFVFTRKTSDSKEEITYFSLGRDGVHHTPHGGSQNVGSRHYQDNWFRCSGKGARKYTEMSLNGYLEAHYVKENYTYTMVPMELLT